MRTRTDEVSIQAVSPLSILEGAGAADAAAAGAPAAGAGASGAAVVAAGDAGCCAVATSVVAPSTSSAASARVSRFTVSPPFRLQGALVALARADSYSRLDRMDEDLAITDVAGLGRRRHDLGHLVDDAVRHDDLDLDLGEEVHRVLTASIQLRVPLLPAEPAHLRHGHADDPDGGEGLLDVVELERLDDRLDLFHLKSSRRVRSSNPHALRASTWKHHEIRRFEGNSRADPAAFCLTNRQARQYCSRFERRLGRPGQARRCGMLCLRIFE